MQSSLLFHLAHLNILISAELSLISSLLSTAQHSQPHICQPSVIRILRSLRHFDIAENLRPGDENLRHLTVTSRFKKNTYIFLAIKRGKVGEIIMWLARIRDYILG